MYQLRTTDNIETTPLVADGVMYLTRANDVIALDAGTGRPYWTYSHPLPDKLLLCCGRQNRGLAILNGRIYMATLDAKLVALDAATGCCCGRPRLRIGRGVQQHRCTRSSSSDKVITGVAGGEFGIRGFIDAYDAVTGARVWRFERCRVRAAGNDTWAGDSWKNGGGADVDDRHVRSGAQSALLGQSGIRGPTGTATGARATISQRFGARARPRHWHAAVAFPVHAA